LPKGDKHLQSPVAFFIFNRPKTTKRVFAEIAKAKPPQLLLVADGPRTDSESDEEGCRAARAVVELVDWDCEVLTNYSELNMGCDQRVSSGLGWVFDLVEQAIILEDDCLPHPTFFPFCDELLQKYCDDERVMMISGDNFLLGKKETSDSYYCSRYPLIWGWASWRRAWKYHDVDIPRWPELRDTGWLFDIHRDAQAAKYWRDVMERVYSDGFMWDYRWAFACWVRDGLSITPAVNLVSNIGFGPGATNTTSDSAAVANLPLQEMLFPLRHPPVVTRDLEADQLTFRHMCPWAYPPGLFERLKRKVAAVKSGLTQSWASDAKQRVVK
jgi:hypothetical protein